MHPNDYRALMDKHVKKAESKYSSFRLSEIQRCDVGYALHAR